jgi:sulfite reductase (ferredoxin)
MSAEPNSPPKPSPVEKIKENSRQLRGTLAEELAQDVDHFNEDNKQLLKFHGTYQQDNRDARKERHKVGAGKAYMFMVRCKIPGGKVSAAQYLALDELADKYATGTLRITSRQGIQFHGVIKSGLKATIAGINRCLLSTLGACGDVERNVMAPAAPIRTPLYASLQQLADEIAAHLAPRTRSYHEIWLDGERVSDGDPCSRVGLVGGEAVHAVPAPPETEPIYGKVYLPRKFKTGLALPQDNSVDIYAQDLGFLAVVENEQITGYNVLVGGGMGMSHGNPNTFPHVARPMCHVQPDQVVAAAEAVIRLYRDYGNRSDRKRARIKYLVHDWGVDKFREVLAGYLPFPLVLPKPVKVTGFPLHLGWHAQGDGKFFYGISVENGRIKDDGPFRLRTALCTLVRNLGADVRLTPMQDILLCDLPESAKAEITKTLRDHGVLPPERISLIQQHSMACPAMPTCGLALSEAERFLPQVIDELEAAVKRLGLAKEPITVRMTGCPNGCARPYQSDIGIVGRSGDKYTIFVGGNLIGDRLNFQLKDLVPGNEIVPLLVPLLEMFKNERKRREGFGDYCQRLGQEKMQALVGATSGHATNNPAALPTLRS